MSETAEYMIRFYPENCTQCHGCETACKVWRDLPYGVRYRRVLNVWEGSYPQMKSAGLSLSCLHCVEPACMEACPVDAIAKEAATGLVLVDAEVCIGCRLCAKACPYGVPRVGADKRMQKCDLCWDRMPEGQQPPCVDTCPGKALVVERLSRDEKKIQEALTRKALEKVAHATQSA